MTANFGAMDEIHASMQQPAHVPKFGNWDGDNVPYTTYFENARRDKIPIRRNFNPNDPQENPDAFASGIFPSEFELKNDDSSNYGLVNQPASKYRSRQDVELNQGYSRRSPAYNRDHQPTSGQRRHNGSPNFSSGKSSSTYNSGSQPPRHRSNRYSEDDSFYTPSPKQPALRPRRSPRIDAMHDMPSSVPRFGVWDEKNPESVNGFTVIFNKVKQEKQIAATKLPRVPSDPVLYGKHTNRTKSSSKSKITCCVRPAVKE